MEYPRVGGEISGYRLERVVARGGMSVVFEADHLRLGRKVALKVLAGELSEDDTFRERFVRESRIAAGLDHPNVIPIYEAGESDGLLFIAMRFVRGPHVKQLIEQVGPLPARRLMSIVGQVASALDAAHALGLVHRDVKPGNILIDPEVGPEHVDHVYLCDFGVTKQKGSHSGLTRTGQFVGTIDYISPEQVEGREVDSRTDIYSLGCVLYECLTGSVPFPKQSEAAVLWAHMQEVPESPTALRSELPPAIDGVVAKAMAKAPGDRFQRCVDLVEAAREALAAPAPVAERVAEPMPAPPQVAAPSSEPPAAWSALDTGKEQVVAHAGRSRRRISDRARAAALGIAMAVAGVAVGWGLATVTGDDDAAGAGTRPLHGGGQIYTTILAPHIPREIAPSCQEKPGHARPAGLEPQHFVYAAAACAPAEVEHVDYFLVHSTESMQHAFLQGLFQHGIQPSTGVRNRLDRPAVSRGLEVPSASNNVCSGFAEAANLWATPLGASDEAHEEIVVPARDLDAGQSVHGLVACYQDAASGNYFMMWTENQTNVLSIAYDSNDRNLYSWWSTQAGPTIEGHYPEETAGGATGATATHG